jgi:hypothetical protein
MTAAHPRTNETRFIGTFPDTPERRTIRSYISINVAAVTKDIRDAIAEWEDLDLDDLLPSPLVGGPGTYPADEVAAVEFIEGALRIPADRIFAATGIRPRTYYGWREGVRKPRASSVGTLWSAVEAVYYLAHRHPNLSAWFKDNTEAWELFDAGKFTDLARLEVEWFARNYGPAPALAPYSHLDDIAAGPSRRRGKRAQVHPVPVRTTRIGARARRTND